jgi:hypothetical protein
MEEHAEGMNKCRIKAGLILEENDGCCDLDKKGIGNLHLFFRARRALIVMEKSNK